jgi:hypothetical protein
MTKSTSAYRVALNLVEQVKQTHVDLVTSNLLNFDRYMALVQEIGETRAKQQLPRDADLVEKIYQSASEQRHFPARLWAAVELDLFEKIEALARAHRKRSTTPGVSELRNDLLALDEYRQSEIDGISGKFWMVATSGVMSVKAEKSRLTVRLVKAWARQRGIAFESLAAAVTAIGNLPSPERPYPSDFNAIFETYPFDLVRDLKDAETWPEFDSDAVAALRADYEATGRFEPSQAKGFGF